MDSDLQINSSLYSNKTIKQLIVIEGPTASGKTALSIALAKQFSTVILSADSRQFYKELSIGTAKPDKEEQAGIIHYFIDSHSIEDNVTAASYAAEAEKILELEFQFHDTIILVGGSGMFIDALCNGLDDIPASPTVRDELTQVVNTNGLEILLTELEQKDPDFYATVDKSNPVRVIRAIEAIRLSGKTFSEMRKATEKIHNFEIHRFVINHPRTQLYDRINRRVDHMIENGLLDEVKSVFEKRHLNALKTVGYTELFAYLEGKIGFSEAVEQIKQNTRRYAKRQLTWFRRHEESRWIPFNSVEIMTKSIRDEISKV